MTEEQILELAEKAIFTTLNGEYGVDDPFEQDSVLGYRKTKEEAIKLFTDYYKKSCTTN